ncbi:E3 ubiquitin/ISG15 ligase TRIM25-like [Rhinophrynus dorsalis]
MMASADLREELNCSICLSIYTDPVTLTCGHNFCQVCITNVLDIQVGSGLYSCPECRAQFLERPALQRNTTLCNIAECFLTTNPEQEETGVYCTYCIHTYVPAAKTCLHCQASLCDKHVKVHSKTAEHVLTEPTTSLGSKICSIHKEALKYYCYNDAAYICATCSLDGEHRGHQVDPLNEVLKNKKNELAYVLNKLTSRRTEAEKRLGNLQEYLREVEDRAKGVTEQVTALFKNIEKPLEALKMRVLSDISRWEEQVSIQVSGLIQQLEIKKDRLSWKMGHIEELCTMTEPLTVLQGWDACKEDFCDDNDVDDLEGDNDIKDSFSGLDEVQIFVTLHAALADEKPNINTMSWFHVQEASDLLLDINTAANNVAVTADLKTASWSGKEQQRVETPQRFQSSQVLSTRSFSSGRHYWEVEASLSGDWIVGMAYPSIQRKGDHSFIGYKNNKSWCLCRYNQKYSAIHDRDVNTLIPELSSPRLGIYLDYNAGRLSFYELCDPVRHLHSFTATFTETLHAVFCVWRDVNSADLCYTWVRIRS